MSQLDRLAELEGFDSDVEMLGEYAFDSVMPGICRNEGCDFVISRLEPDATNVHCDLCNTDTVDSCMVLAGVI